MITRYCVLAVLVIGAALSDRSATAQGLSVLALLDRYSNGQFDAVVEILSGDIDFGDLLKQVRRDAPGWIDRTEAADRHSRELIAVTFALEAARAGEWREWKLVQMQPKMCAPNGECGQPMNVLYWKAPPLLIEWACERLRRYKSPLPNERWWQLAALAVAQRSEDTQFLVGDPNIGRGVYAGEIGNTQDEIKHLDHVSARFPNEMRFVLAQGIARDRVWIDDATKAYLALEKNPDVGGEAMMRFGAMQVRLRRFGDALIYFERAESLTRDSYVVFLANYFKGQLFEQQRSIRRAEEAYRRAVATVPHAQSATMALSALVFRDGRRTEAHQLVKEMLAAKPPPLDPWRAYVHADDRFWPQLVGRLRAEIIK
jgi:tetratricopeptide (TPR) repeat protein